LKNLEGGKIMKKLKVKSKSKISISNQEHRYLSTQQQPHSQMPMQMASPIFSYLYQLWIAEGVSKEEATAKAQAAINKIWENRKLKGTWVLSLPVSIK
jgi:hypothetical protein